MSEMENDPARGILAGFRPAEIRIDSDLFTREDVNAICDAARELVTLSHEATEREAAEKHARELLSIADRIAALLPP